MAQLKCARRRPQDLPKVIWQLDGEQTGTVVAYGTTPDGRRVYEKFVLDRTADWAELPSPVASIVQQADDTNGQWAIDQ